MKVRPDVFDAYWKFAAERQRIYYRRLANWGAPWTRDPVLQQYKFCNAYRASDRASQYLIRHVLYDRGSYGRPAVDVFFRVVLFRLFNRVGTWEHLWSKFGEPSVESFDVRTYGAALSERIDAGESVFGGAFILCANKAFGFDRKHDNYLALIQHMLEDRAPDRAAARGSFQGVYDLLYSYPLIGEFMAYQIATDLNYSTLVDFDEDSFTMAGPGAKSGIRKVFEDTGGLSDEDVIRWMVDRQEAEFRARGIDPAAVWLWGRPLKAIDIQNLFCEVDKYCRVAMPKVRHGRTRIKAKFNPSPGVLTPFYPPKWGINDRLTSIPPTDPL